MGAIVSNPTHIKLIKDSINSIDMLSGETITKDINCKYIYIYIII